MNAQRLRQRLARPTALVIVDMQNDYCVPEGIIGSLGYDVSGSARVAERVQALIDGCRGLVDRIVFVRTEIPSWLRSPSLTVHYSRSSLARTVADDLSDWYVVRPLPQDLVVTKHRYSPFVDSQFPAVLRAASIETLIVAGVTTEVCVESTVRDAFMRDYAVLVAGDCTSATTPQRQEQSLALMDAFFATVAASEDILGALHAARA